MADPAQELSTALRGAFDAAGLDVAGDCLTRFEQRARGSWPAFEPPPSALATTLVSKIQSAPDPVAALDALDPAEVWLAAGCAAADPTALRAFEHAYVRPIGASLRAAARDQAQVDEVMQRLRRRLLGNNAEGVARLLVYAGQGRLAALVKVTAMRIAVDVAREEQRHGSTRADRTLDGLIAAGAGPEQRAMLDEHAEAIKLAFEAAVAELAPAERTVLRMHLLEGVSVDGIAALQRVHRSTAARRLGRLREQLAVRVRALLRARLRISEPTLDSLFGAVDAHLDLSLARVLHDDPRLGVEGGEDH